MKYLYKYIEGLPDPASPSLVIGSSVHYTAATNLQNYIDVGSYLDVNDIPDMAADASKAEWDKQEIKLIDEREIEIGPEKTRGEAIDTAVSLSLLHYNELAPGFDPEFVEREFRIHLPNYDYDLIGGIDVQESGNLRDLKTAGKTPAKDAAERNLQLTIYAMAIAALDSKLPNMVTLDFLVKLKTPKVVICESTRDKSDFHAVIKRVELASKIIRSGVYYPATDGAWWCSEKYCNYYDLCPFGRRNSKQF